MAARTCISDIPAANDGQNTTIAAIATPLGRSGIGIIRLSGPTSLSILSVLFRPSRGNITDNEPWRLIHGTVHNLAGHLLDDILAVYMPGPRTYTGEDVVELHCHGGPAILANVLATVLATGAVTAGPGDFTRRAFLNGRLDLSQAEAVAECIEAQDAAGARLAQNRLAGGLKHLIQHLDIELRSLRERVCLAVDFPDEEVECLEPAVFAADIATIRATITKLTHAHERTRCWREGARVTLTGRVNVGKSSLLNVLLGRNRAIVAPTPGTTRDYIEESILLDGLSVRLTDTAGLRIPGDEPADTAEAEGLRRSMEQIKDADCCLLILDLALGEAALGPTETLLFNQIPPERILAVGNKLDLFAARAAASTVATALKQRSINYVFIAATTGQGIDDLTAMLRSHLTGENPEPEPNTVTPNIRQANILARADAELANLTRDLSAGIPPDLLAVRLENVAADLAEITGETHSNAILDSIFAHFCVGK
ncbi:tRNA modification GTPase MnmE [Desulfovibrionales bacterium]